MPEGLKDKTIFALDMGALIAGAKFRGEFEERFEIHHGLRITDGALIACATLSERYISDRFLPDKAIDLMDEAASKIRTEIDSLPAELDEMSRKIMQLEIEKQALSKEKDAPSKHRLEILEKELSELKAENATMRAQWETEKKSITDLKDVKQQVEEVKHQIEEAERKYDLELLAKLKYGTLPELEKKMYEAEEAQKEVDERKLLKEEVTESEIAEIVSGWTGIPISRLVETEREKLLKLPEILHRRVIAQEDAVTAVSEAVLRARAGLKDVNRPIGSFIFLGPTGVGKTELAKALSESLFDSEKSMNRIDDIVVFSPLTANEITKIIDITLVGLQARLSERNITIELSQTAKEFIAKESYAPSYGARPVKRYLQKHVETEMAGMIIKGEIQDGDKITLDSDGDKLNFSTSRG